MWATIVKDYPIFQEQNRRSTDLRDRFRNAFPELYQLAGYKPRNNKKTSATASVTGGSKKAAMAMDDQQVSTSGPVRSRKRAHTHQGLLRGGTKSVPQSTACSEDDESGEESESYFSPFKAPPTPPSAKKPTELPPSSLPSLSPTPTPTMPSATAVTDQEDEEMDLITLDPLAEALSLPDISRDTDTPLLIHNANTWHHLINPVQYPRCMRVQLHRVYTLLVLVLMPVLLMLVLMLRLLLEGPRSQAKIQPQPSKASERPYPSTNSTNRRTRKGRIIPLGPRPEYQITRIARMVRKAPIPLEQQRITVVRER